MEVDVLPGHISEVLERHGILSTEVNLSVCTDISAEGEFCETWVVLASGRFAVLAGQSCTDTNIRLSDPEILRKNGCTVWNEIKFELFQMDKIKDIKSENLASCGRLIANVDGCYRLICHFSNRLAGKVSLFVKLANKLKDGSALNEEDFLDDQAPAVCPKCGLAYDEPERKICPKCLDKRKVFTRVLSYAVSFKKQIIIIVLFMLASSAFNLLGPYLSGKVLFDDVLVKEGNYYGEAAVVILLIIAARVSALLTGIIYGRINSAFTAEVIFRIKTDVFSAMQRLSLGFYIRKQTGNLMTRVNYDANNLQNFFHDGLPFFIVNLATIAGIAGIMLYMNWKLALMALIPVPVVLVLIKYVVGRSKKLLTKKYKKTSAMNSLINDTLTGMRVVKVFGREEDEINRFNNINNGVFSADVNLNKLQNTVLPLMYYAMGFGGFIVWGFGGWQVLDGYLTFGSLMTFVGYMTMLFGPMQFMTRIVDWWTNCMNSAQRIFEIIDSVPDVVEKPDPVRMPSIKGDIVFDNVSFNYAPNKPVLSNICLDIKAGELIGVVGKTGAGKSTLANLIIRLYDVKSGGIYIDGINIRDICLRDLQSQISLVSQETYTFMGSIADNIRYARPDAGADDVIRAAKAANAHDFITKLPDGYETRIGTGGRQLSGGEMQRISIARAVLRNPRILILDEATASVDTETEKQIQEALKRLASGRTTISIAHRLSTLRDADRLVVIENGSVVELGTHDALIQMKKIYFNLVMRQSEAMKIKGVG